MTSSNKTAFLGTPKSINLMEPNSVLLLSTFDLNTYNIGLYDQFQINYPDTLTKAVKKRQADYLAGRALTKQALECLGQQAPDIRAGQDRAPIWPQGINGSISHTKGQVACLLTTQQSHLVGVDVERDLTENGLKSVKHMALLPSEHSFLAQQTELPETQLVGAIFSAKETLFKALYPIVRCFFGFDAAACVAVSPTILRMELIQDLHATLPAGRVFDVQMRLLDRYVLTWLFHNETL